MVEEGALELYAVVSEAVGDWPPPEQVTLDHIAFLRDLEARGVSAISGPLLQGDGSWQGEGITVIRASSMEEAERIMSTEPYSSQGLRRQKVLRWHVTSGRFALSVNLTEPSAKVG